MDLSLNGDRHTNSRSGIDRPPRSPMRTMSTSISLTVTTTRLSTSTTTAASNNNKKKPTFTRSRVFPSIRRQERQQKQQEQLMFWIRLWNLMIISFFIMIGTYWYHIHTIVRSHYIIQPTTTTTTTPKIRTDTANTSISRLRHEKQLQPQQQRKQSQQNSVQHLEQRRQEYSTTRQHNSVRSIDTSKSTYNSTSSSTKFLTKQERIAPLLELIEIGKQDGGLIRNWPSQYKLHQLPFDTRQVKKKNKNDIQSCIVTAYFRLPNSKHTIEQYDRWIQNMLSMKDCMIIFCESDMVSKMVQYRTFSNGTNNQSNNMNHYAIGPTAIIELSINDLPISKYYVPSITGTKSSNEFWYEQLQIDPEQKLHGSYQLFWIWLSKSWFITTAALLQHHLFSNILSLDHKNIITTWMWADIGSFRSSTYNNEQLIPHNHQKAFTQIVPNDNTTIVWMAHRRPDPPLDPYWNNKLDKKEKYHFYHSGSQGIANNMNAWILFHTHFVDTLDDYVSMGKFIGEDQCILQTTCLLYPMSCAYVPYNQVNDNRYFGLRYVIKNIQITNNSSNTSKRNTSKFHLWRPPPRT